jgi:hypothetical protein
MTTVRDAIRTLPSYHSACLAMEALFRIPLDTPLPRAIERLRDLEARECRKYPHWSYDSARHFALQQYLKALEAHAK